MNTLPDWTHRGEYIRTRSARKGSEAEQDVDPAWANEAYQDPFAVTFRPDPTSRSGDSDRTIGWSSSAGFVVTVITVIEGERLWGVNAWKANTTDINHYERGT